MSSAWTICLCVAIVLSAGAARAEQPRVWFAPLDPLYRPALGGGGARDFMELFRSNASWAKAASRVRVFKLTPRFVRQASDADLRQVIEGLKKRHIALAIEFGMLRDTEKCGRGVEGYGGEDAGVVASRIRHLGGTLAYIVMDEPLWFGRDASVPNACHASIAAIARDAVQNAQPVKEAFPNVIIGDIEPISNFQRPNWLGELSRWFAAYRAAAKRPLAFAHADVDWSKPWLARLQRFRDVVTRGGLRFGIIYNGSARYKTDRDWIESAERHFVAYESDGRLPPDDVIFQSWERVPTHVLPETSAAAFSNLINRYFGGFDRRASSHPRGGGVSSRRQGGLGGDERPPRTRQLPR